MELYEAEMLTEIFSKTKSHLPHMTMKLRAARDHSRKKN